MVLREIWQLASVFKMPFLTEFEFAVYLKYVALA